MAYNFPDNPTPGQVFDKWTWDGYAWKLTPPDNYTKTEADTRYVNVTGDTMTGHLDLPTGPAASQAVRKDYVDAGLAAVDLSSKVSKSGDTMTGVLIMTLPHTVYSALRAPTSINPSDWDSSFRATPNSGWMFGSDVNGGTGAPGAGWWFTVNMRHANSGSYWGMQQAWGWEDRANELYTRNWSGGTAGGWVRFLNSSNYSAYALPISGGTVTGELVAGQGYLRFGASGSGSYIQYSGGSTYYLGSAGNIWHTGNFNPASYASGGRLAFAGDYNYNTNTDPNIWLGSVTAALWNDNAGTYYARHRWVQLLINGGWATFGTA